VRISIFDDGAGNVHSLTKVLASSGEVTHERDAKALCDADVVVLPGVGAFDTAMASLGDAASILSSAIDGGLACLAICLGAQLLFDSSEEGERDGLGVVPGTVRRLGARRLPHIGWEVVTPSGLGEPTLESSGLMWGYYAHSFACPQNGMHRVTSTSRIEGQQFPATIRYANVLGVQFHPEKSSSPGVAMVRSFLEEVAP
jgi:imidazole glycerol-phosphate synthase subunit HisH